MLPAEQQTIGSFFVIEALLKHNYLPAQKGNRDELPPIFNSTSFSINAAEELANITPRRNGYDSLKYATTRYNQTARTLSIPHPLPYSHIALQIADNWEALAHISKNSHSHIKPVEHDGGRILTMNYQDEGIRLENELEASLGKNFCVRADIRQCFSSIPNNLFSLITNEMEIRPISMSDTKPNYRGRWFYKLERSLVFANCNQSVGLHVGSATSNIVSEYLLCHIDRKLERKGFAFHRYIDDYVCYCTTHEEAEAFLWSLRDALKQYRLELNDSKTSITALPTPLSPDWIIDLTAALPALKHDQCYYSFTQSVRYLDYALRLQQQNPNGGAVLKYAVKSIIHHLDEMKQDSVICYVLNLSRKYPFLLPILESLSYRFTKLDEHNHLLIHNLLREVVLENAKYHHADGMTWGLYFLDKIGVGIDDEVMTAVFKTRDPVALACLYCLGGNREQITDFLEYGIDKADLWAVDRYWLLYYQLYQDHRIPNPYPQDNVFEILRFHSVNFMPEFRTAKTEGGHEQNHRKRY